MQRMLDQIIIRLECSVKFYGFTISMPALYARFSFLKQVRQ